MRSLGGQEDLLNNIRQELQTPPIQMPCATLEQSSGQALQASRDADASKQHNTDIDSNESDMLLRHQELVRIQLFLESNLATSWTLDH